MGRLAALKRAGWLKKKVSETAGPGKKVLHQIPKPAGYASIAWFLLPKFYLKAQLHHLQTQARRTGSSIGEQRRRIDILMVSMTQGLEL